jgi:hypothetical protein
MEAEVSTGEWQQAESTETPPSFRAASHVKEPSQELEEEGGDFFGTVLPVEV